MLQIPKLLQTMWYAKYQPNRFLHRYIHYNIYKLHITNNVKELNRFFFFQIFQYTSSLKLEPRESLYKKILSIYLIQPGNDKMPFSLKLISEELLCKAMLIPSLKLYIVKAKLSKIFILIKRMFFLSFYWYLLI